MQAAELLTDHWWCIGWPHAARMQTVMNVRQRRARLYGPMPRKHSSQSHFFLVRGKHQASTGKCFLSLSIQTLIKWLETREAKG